MSVTENPFISLQNCIAFDSKDYSLNKRDIWIYGIVLGWGDPDRIKDQESLFKEFVRNHGMTSQEWLRIQKLHKEFEVARVIYEKVKTKVWCNRFKSFVWDIIPDLDMQAECDLNCSNCKDAETNANSLEVIEK